MKKTLFAFVGGLVAVAAVTSCNNDNNNVTPPVAAFGVVNASPNSGNVDVYLNGSPVVYMLPYGTDTGYYSVQAGTYTLTIDTAGSATPWYNQSISFAAGVNYSVFAIDSAQKMQTSVVVDSFTAPSGDTALIRFLDYSPNTGAIDVAVQGGSVLFSNRTYNDVAANASFAQFGNLTAGTYTLEVRAAGTSTVLFTFPNFTVTGGKVYTLFAKGFTGGDGGQALTLDTVAHN